MLTWEYNTPAIAGRYIVQLWPYSSTLMVDLVYNGGWKIQGRDLEPTPTPDNARWHRVTHPNLFQPWGTK